jgi:hypothetical protein
MNNFNNFSKLFSYEEIAFFVSNSSTNVFIFLDRQDDSELVPTLQAMVLRSEAYMGECKRRKVKFLPKQVMRPILAGKGLTEGVLLKSRGTNYLTYFGKS